MTGFHSPSCMILLHSAWENKDLEYIVPQGFCRPSVTADSMEIIHFIKKSHCTQHTMHSILLLGSKLKVSLSQEMNLFLTPKYLQMNPLLSFSIHHFFGKNERERERKGKGWGAGKTHSIFFLFYPKPPGLGRHYFDKIYSQVSPIANITNSLFYSKCFSLHRDSGQMPTRPSRMHACRQQISSKPWAHLKRLPVLNPRFCRWLGTGTLYTKIIIDL